jgi:hypothetical protein
MAPADAKVITLAYSQVGTRASNAAPEPDCPAAHLAGDSGQPLVYIFGSELA